MTSVEVLRDFINERLAAAAGEIFSVFQQTIVQYEEELDRQHKLLETRWEPPAMTHTTEPPQEDVCATSRTFNPETLLLDREASPPQAGGRWEGTESPRVKEEQQEPESSQSRPDITDVSHLLKLEPETMTAVPPEPSRFGAPRPDGEWLLLPPRRSAALEDGQNADSGIPASADALPSPRSQKLGQTGARQYACEICGKTCNRKTNLLVHMRIHTGEKPYGCQTCGKSFKYQHYFLIHMRNHTGETPFACGGCGKKFSSSSSLIKHRRVHADRKHRCAACGECFSQKAHLATHAKLHAGGELHACDTCGKSFTRRRNLAAHLRSHQAGDQACRCGVCGRGFSSRSSLLVHVRRHTGEEPRSCDAAPAK